MLQRGVGARRKLLQAWAIEDDHITAVGLNCVLAFQDVERDRHSRPPHAEHQGQKVVR